MLDLWDSEVNNDNDDSGLRLLHHLNREDLFLTKYSKMNVASAVHVFSIKTAGALETAVRLRELPADALTTAWFVREVNDWFKIMSARYCKEGITIDNQAEKFEFLNNFIHTIQHMTFDKCWKPVQTGIIMSAISVMNVFGRLHCFFSNT